MFTAEKRNKFPIKFMYNFPPHLKNVAALPLYPTLLEYRMWSLALKLHPCSHSWFSFLVLFSYFRLVPPWPVRLSWLVATRKRYGFCIVLHCKNVATIIYYYEFSTVLSRLSCKYTECAASQHLIFTGCKYQYRYISFFVELKVFYLFGHWGDHS